MDNMQDIISSVLSNPDAVQKLRSLGKDLGLMDNSTSDNQPDKNSTAQHSTAQHSSQQNPPFDISALSGLLSPQNKSNQNTSLSPEIMSRISSFLPLLSGINQEDDTTALLNSLRPFLSGDKHRRLDEAEKMLRIMRLLPKLRQSGLI